MKTFVQLCAIAIAMGCSLAYAAPATQKTPEPAVVETTYKDPGHIERILPEFTEYAQKAMEDWHVPGIAIAIIKPEGTVYAEGFGVRRMGTAHKVTPYTIFPIGSTSKAFTTTLAAMLVDKGQLKWDDKVVSHYPKFKMYDPWVSKEFTVEDLFAQRSGLPTRAGDVQTLLGYNRDYILNSLQYIKPVSSFRSKYAYQNVFFMLGGQVFQKVTGETYENLLHNRIFAPLGMKYTTVGFDGFKSAGNLATSLHNNESGELKLVPRDHFHLDPYYTYAAAGGINSNVKDMAKWVRMQLNEGKVNDVSIVSKANLDYTRAPHILTDASYFNRRHFYGLGWAYTEFKPAPILWHTGQVNGATSLVMMVPGEKVGLVILSNSSSDLPMALGYDFIERYFGKTQHQWAKTMRVTPLKALAAAEEEATVPPHRLSFYEGKYHNNIYGDITIHEKRDQLQFVLGPKAILFHLRPHRQNTFTLHAENLDGEFGKATFTLDERGKAESMLIDSLAEEGDGNFMRVREED